MTSALGCWSPMSLQFCEYYIVGLRHKEGKVGEIIGEMKCSVAGGLNKRRLRGPTHIDQIPINNPG